MHFKANERQNPKIPFQIFVKERDWEGSAIDDRGGRQEARKGPDWIAGPRMQAKRADWWADESDPLQHRGTAEPYKDFEIVEN